MSVDGSPFTAEMASTSQEDILNETGNEQDGSGPVEVMEHSGNADDLSRPGSSDEEESNEEEEGLMTHAGGEEEEEDEEEDFDRRGSDKKSSQRSMAKEDNAEHFAAFEFGATEVDAQGTVTPDEVPEDFSLEAGQWRPSNVTNVAVVNKRRRFVCVDYPGVIRNKDKAVATLGGVSRIAEVTKQESKLELYFRPDDPFCKPAISNYQKAENLLIKCLRRRLPAGDASSSQGDGYEYKIEVLGLVEGRFDYNLPADYQYLPVAKGKDGAPRELLSDIMIKFEDERNEYLSRDVPLFALPFSFSRHERPARYHFQSDAYENEDEDLATGTVRKARHSGFQSASFADETVPQGPLKECNKALVRYRSDLVTLCREHLEKLFKERPIWTKKGLLAHIPSETYHLLKYVLPSISYNMLSGPWRHAWCVYGYDPKKHKDAKKYQIIDFRLRSSKTQYIKNKRSYNSRFNRTMKPIKKQGLGSIDKDEVSTPEAIADADTTMKDLTGTAGSSSCPPDVNLRFQYVPGITPPHRNVFYQLCDIFDETVQELLHQNDGQEKECTERDGWCIPNFTDNSRDILREQTESQIQDRNWQGTDDIG